MSFNYIHCILNLFILFLVFIYSLLSQNTKTYFFRLDHIGALSTSDMFVDKYFIPKVFLGLYETRRLGTAHGDDILLMFEYV